ALPWRLGVETDGEDTLLTVFRGGACPEVAVFERRVKTVDLRRALLEALAEASATSTGPSDPSFDAAAAALRHPWPSYLGLPVPRRACKVAPKRSRGFGFAIEAEFRQRPQPLEEADKSALLEQADLHSLLLEGRFKIASKTRKVALASVQPFLLTERVVALAEDVLDAWQTERALFRRVEIDGVRLGVRRGAGDGPLTLTVNTRATTPDGKTFSFSELAATDFVRASVALALELTRAFTSADPSQQRNLRLTALEASAKRLGERLRDAELDDVHTNPEPETYRSFGLPRSEASVDGVWAHGARMRFMPRWVATVPGIDLRGTFLCGNRVIVGSQRELACIDRATGNVYWRAATPPATSVATPSGVVR